MREVGRPLEDALSGTNRVVDVSLTAVVPLAGGFPPRVPLERVARLALGDGTLGVVRPIKPVSRWGHEVRRALEVMGPDQPHADGGSLVRSATERLAAAIDRHLGTVRIAAVVDLTANDDYRAAWRKDFLLVTSSHVAVLALSIDD